MNHFDTAILLISAAILLVGFAQKMRIPYPTALIIGGGIMGFIPGLDSFFFNPNLILVLVLPPILYYGAFWVSHREFKKNMLEIFSLAIGLVIATTCIVALVFKWLFPEVSWALAFVFGAIISPPDAISAITILKRFSISPRLLTILEGESLINDAFALLLYKVAVIALLSGQFSWSEASIDFVKIVIGGLLMGTITGFVIQNFSSRFLTPVAGVMFSFAIPYIIYIFADEVGVSGVLAVVINGLILSRVFIKHPTSFRRVVSVIAWDVYIISLNCFVFILIGFQLRATIQQMTLSEMGQYTFYGFIITIVMIIIRMVWVYTMYGITYLTTQRDIKSQSHYKQILREGAIVGWSGMRGIISLTVVLALPLNLPGAIDRSVLIFITFIVTLLTLLIPGLTLPKLIKWLKIQYSHDASIEQNCRDKLLKIADKEIMAYAELKEEERSFLLNYFNMRNRLFGNLSSIQVHKLELIRHAILQTQRKFLIQLSKDEEIDDKTLKLLELELDSEESLFIKIIQGEIA